jgi:hypothetical protein
MVRERGFEALRVTPLDPILLKMSFQVCFCEFDVL